MATLRRDGDTSAAWLQFATKPPQAIRDELKRRDWRWHGTREQWFNRPGARVPQAIRVVDGGTCYYKRESTGAPAPTPPPSPAPPAPAPSVRVSVQTPPGPAGGVYARFVKNPSAPAAPAVQVPTQTPAPQVPPAPAGKVPLHVLFVRTAIVDPSGAKYNPQTWASAGELLRALARYATHAGDAVTLCAEWSDGRRLEHSFDLRPAQEAYPGNLAIDEVRMLLTWRARTDDAARAMLDGCEIGD